ncbi:MAG: dUTP diphosphatase [Candidatus Diapherotrites archaeon]|uniref:dUTP diphosphatase n=1 Tax=Candidatus Iainarchaeum sp. TaxID=3101447 RepID=A0A939C4X9_9ARCH|nr:dUTP diphosphatase [Candidatus Diapherotrites archaeon]
MKIALQKVSGNAKMPSYAHPGDSGMDLYSSEDIVLKPGERKLVKTGIKIAVPEGFEAQVRPKSGIAVKNGVTVLNTPGTIDSGYRGEVQVILVNLGKEAFKVEKGKKIAQLVIAKVEQAEIEEVEKLDDTSRNTGGFGSTGLE